MFTWATVQASDLRVGDYIRASRHDGTGTVRQGVVLGVDPTDVALSDDLFINPRVRHMERLTVSSGSEGQWVAPTTENLVVGARIQGTPTGIGGHLHATVTRAGDPIVAVTTEVLDPTNNGRSYDEGATYRYPRDQIQVWAAAPVQISRPQVGDRFTRTFDDGGDSRLDCVVETVETLFEGMGWAVGYRSPRGAGNTLVVRPDGTCASTQERHPGRYVPTTDTPGTAQDTTPATWHPIPFSDLRVGDTARVTFNVLMRMGTVTEIQGARARFSAKDGMGSFSGTSLRSYEISNRVPVAQPPVTERYPSIHHLRAAIYDVAMTHYKSGAWCSDVHDWVAELDIARDLRPESGQEEQASMVQELIAKLQGETPGARGIGHASFRQATEALGIQPQGPRLKSLTIQVSVPADWDSGRLERSLSEFASSVVVESVTENGAQ